jgi:hypothetical protein
MKKVIALASLLVAASAARAQYYAIPVQLCGNTATQAFVSGLQSTNYLAGVIRGCTVTVYLTDTSTKATLYSNATGSTLGNPFTADLLTGKFLAFAANGQGYDVVLSGGGANPSCTTTPNCYAATLTITDIFAGGGSGGGGGMVWPTFTGLAKYGGSSNWLTPTYADVVALFSGGSCTGYLKSDGTCSTGTGVTSLTVATANGFQGAFSSGSTPILTLNVDSTHVLPINTGASTSYLNQAGSYSVPPGSYTLPNATTSTLGGVKPDGVSCTTAAGVLTCPGTGGTAPVLLATTGNNITLSGEQTIDGVPTASSRVLVKDQTAQAQNGVYVTGSGAWGRASDFASPVTGNTVYVTAGATNFDTVFAVDAPNPITVGSSQLTFRPKGPYAFVYPGAFPCDIVAAGGQTCKAAYSLVRRMFAAYSGNLYQVTRASDSTTTNVGTLSSGLVNIATETAFCAGTTCTRSKIYDQTGTSANDLIPYSASPEYYVAVPSSWTTMPSGLVLPINRFGMTNGYATASGASGLPSGNSSITVYMLAENYSEGGIINGCCGLFNQSENPVRDAGMGKMFGAAFSTGNAVDCVNLGTGTGPFAGIDLEEGVCLYGGTPSQNYLAVLGKYNTSGTTFAVKSSDITQGRWTTLYNAGLPAGYTMNLEQNVTVGMGGDGTPSPGNWMEGAVIAGTTSDATDNALQGNFVSFFGPAQTAVPNTVRANLTYSINGYTSPATTALPAKGLFLNQVVYTTNAASYSDCTAGGGTTFNACHWNGTAWVPLFPTGGSMVWPSSPGYALWQSGTSWSTPSLTDSGGNVNSSEPFVVNASSVASQIAFTYNTGHALVPGSSTTVVSGPDASGKDMVSEGGGAAAERCNTTNGVCASPVATIISSGAISVVAQNTYVICTAACTITPLAPALSVQLCVRNGPDTDAVITLAALGSGKVYELVDHTTYGTPNHTVVSGGSSYDESCWIGYSTTAYSNWNSSGTWTD